MVFEKNMLISPPKKSLAAFLSINKSHTHSPKSPTKRFPNVPHIGHPIFINIYIHYTLMHLKTQEFLKTRNITNIEIQI